MQASTMYNDFSSLAGLRSEAQANPDAALEEVASQFESLFVQMMLKSMRDATIDGGLFDSSQMDTYQGMFDQQLSLDLSNSGGLGLADVLVEQLRPAGVAALTPGVDLEPLAISQIPKAPTVPITTAAWSTHIGYDTSSDNDAKSTAKPPLLTAANEPWQPATPEEFVEELWPVAQSAADQLGLDPKVLLAQAALETGWGKHITSTEAGSSLNLFNIKAGNEWEGERAVVNTIEFTDGVAGLERAAFKVYGSLAESFDDYVNLIQNSPRYQQALQHVDSASQYLNELQDAGYATDPQYAAKILRILDTESPIGSISP